MVILTVCEGGFEYGFGIISEMLNAVTKNVNEVCEGFRLQRNVSCPYSWVATLLVILHWVPMPHGDLFEFFGSPKYLHFCSSSQFSLI